MELSQRTKTKYGNGALNLLLKCVGQPPHGGPWETIGEPSFSAIEGSDEIEMRIKIRTAKAKVRKSS
jgi:hypothetical protein